MISTAQKLACAQRELAMRRAVYPKWVTAGRLRADKAAHEIAAMEAIVADYQAALDREGG